MSDHDAPDESGINRAWLCGALILASLALAAIPAWSKAAPRARQAPPNTRNGVVVLANGTVEDGMVLLRGPSSITLIQRGGELVIPREKVLLFDVDFDRAQRPKGVVVFDDLAGSVHEGHLLRRDDVVWLLRGDRALALEADSWRWIQETGSTLSEDYWKRYPVGDPSGIKTSAPRVGALPEKPVDTPREIPSPADVGSPRRKADALEAASTARWAKAARSDPEIAKALKATTHQRWVVSADLWLGLYAKRGTKVFFKNYAADASKAVQEAWVSFKREPLLARVDRLISDAKARNLLVREEVQQVLAAAIRKAARMVWFRGYRKTAHDLIDYLSSLAPKYEREAGVYWEELNRTPPQLNFEGSGH